MSLIAGCCVHEASGDALAKGFAWISLSLGVTEAVPSVELLWGELVTPLQLLPALNWLQLFLGTQVPPSCCQAVAPALCSLHLWGPHRHRELRVVLLTRSCQDCLRGGMIQRRRSCGCWPGCGCRKGIGELPSPDRSRRWAVWFLTQTQGLGGSSSTGKYLFACEP